MNVEQILQLLSIDPEDNSRLRMMEFAPGKTLSVYPRSVNLRGNQYFFIAREAVDKFLCVLTPGAGGNARGGFSGGPLKTDLLEGGSALERFQMNHANAALLQSLFDFTRPRLIGTDNSIGLGDRLGIAGPGHLRAVEGTDMKIILAQQSIRELERTARTPEEVMDAAVWSVFQEGWRNGFGADADHLKTEQDIDLMLRAGYTMVTIDPGAHVRNGAGAMSQDELIAAARGLDWNLLEDSSEKCVSRYADRKVAISGDFALSPSRMDVLCSIVKYGGAVAHARRLYRHIMDNHPGYQFELELSVDETDSDTTPFEHYFIVNELKRLAIRLVSLAPRFVGGFEKGIDYRGNLTNFIGEYRRHVQIAEFLGPYKISYHSGSDKFRVYEAVGKLKTGRVHVKTAGTSYLEALHTIAMVNPDLFRRIYAFSRDCYETEKRSYHVSANLSNIPAAESLPDSCMEELFLMDDARQVLHVAFGRVLTGKDPSGNPLFRKEIMDCLARNEEMHYAMLKNHFRRHIDPFLK